MFKLLANQISLVFKTTAVNFLILPNRQNVGTVAPLLLQRFHGMELRKDSCSEDENLIQCQVFFVIPNSSQY